MICPGSHSQLEEAQGLEPKSTYSFHSITLPQWVPCGPRDRCSNTRADIAGNVTLAL